MKKTVVYMATRNLYHNMVKAARSCAANGGVDEIILLIEDDRLGFCLPEICRTVNISAQPWIDRNGPNTHKRWTWMVLMKAAITKILPECDQVLLLDCDTIVEHDLGELWDLNMWGCYFAAVKQHEEHGDGRDGAFMPGDYFNAGVLMCNLAMLRRYNMDGQLIETLNTHSWDFNEQDAINKLCAGRIRELPGRWNVSDYTVEDTETYIRHFAARPELFAEYSRLYDLEEED